VIVVESARRDGVEIGFVEHFLVGAPITVLTLLLAWAWLALGPV
jgi:Na+/H+ antiporter NhaD/arsenite permease-like protein